MKEVNRYVVIPELVNNAELGLELRVLGGMCPDNVRRAVLIVLMMIGGSGWMMAQEKDMYGNSVNRDLCTRLMSFGGDAEVNDLVTRIMDVYNLPNRYKVGSCPRVDNAIATVDEGGAPVILYNPEFFKRIKGFSFTASDLPTASEDWGALLVLAHEIGHHLCEHITNPHPGMSPWDKELEADEKAGFILYLMEAPDLGTAQSGLRVKQVPEEGSYTHPPRSKRLEAFKKGWDKAEKRYPRPLPVVRTPCSAMVSATDRKEFMCHNLGAANTSADPFTPSWEINGGYWQWGRKEMAAAGPSGPGSGQAKEGKISGWNTNDAPNGAWKDGLKTVNDPCPSGYRVPTKAEWDGALKNNILSNVGSWENSSTNYSCGKKIGDLLFLPAAGYRYGTNGALVYRGDYGFYWSSTEDGSAKAWNLTSLVEMPIPTTTTAPTGDPFAVSQNNSTIYLFDYLNFFGLKGRYYREAVENIFERWE